jgi:hypothetical protein
MSELIIEFDGETYDHSRDYPRLNYQLHRVFRAMRDGQWYTLKQLATLSWSPEASVSARIRDLRKEKFGGFTIQTRRAGSALGHTTNPHWQYRLADGPAHSFERYDN